METAKIEQDVVNLLNLSGIDNEGLVVQQTLHHMLMCVKLYETLDAEQRARVAKWRKHFQFLTNIRFNLKERKGRKDKKASPSYSPIKERPQEAKADEMIYIAGGAKEAFREECLKRIGQYNRDRLADFFNYWSEENPRTGKMRFQGKRYWNLDSRLKRWMNTQYSVDNTAAAERLKRARGKQAQEQTATAQQREQAAEREARNCRRARGRQRPTRTGAGSEQGRRRELRGMEGNESANHGLYGLNGLFHEGYDATRAGRLRRCYDKDSGQLSPSPLGRALGPGFTSPSDSAAQRCGVVVRPLLHPQRRLKC